MLVLSRRQNEAIVIQVGGEVVRVMVVDTRGDRARIGIDAPRHVAVDREEVYESKLRDLKPAA